MAAPSHLFTHKVVSQKTGRADKLVLLTSAAETSTVLKTRFYLDGFFIREHNGVKKWAGYCVVGSTNYYMHAEARHSWLRERRNGQDIVVFWDAGLNTFGLSSILQTKKHHTNFMAVQMSGLASYYSHTSSWGIQVKKSTEAWGVATTLNLGGLLPAQEVGSQYYVMRYVYNTGDTLNIRAFHENEEGTKYSDVISRSLDLPPILQQVAAFVSGSSTPCSEPTETPLVLMTEATRLFLETFTSPSNVNTGHYIYLGEPFNNPLDANGEFIPVPSGYYRGLDGVYAHVFFVSAQGEVMRRTVCTPTLPHLGYLSILPGFAPIENPELMTSELVYVVDQVVGTAYTIEGFCQEYIGNSGIGAAKPFKLTVAANGTVPTWVNKPAINNMYGGKHKFVNVTITPNTLGTITQTDEI